MEKGAHYYFIFQDFNRQKEVVKKKVGLVQLVSENFSVFEQKPTEVLAETKVV